MLFRPVSLLQRLSNFRGGFPDARAPSSTEWRAVDTVTVTTGVFSFRPLLSVAKLKHDSDHVGLEGVKYVEMAQLALYLGGGKLE